MESTTGNNTASTRGDAGILLASLSSRIYKRDHDEYLVEWSARDDAGIVGPLDRSNLEIYRAEQAASIFLEDADECDRAQILTGLAEVTEAARITAALDRLSNRATGHGQERYAAQAVAMSHHCATLRKRLDEFDLGRLEGLLREPARQTK